MSLIAKDPAASLVVMPPTIGRKVWYYPPNSDSQQDATVIDVHGDRIVSVFVIDRAGETSAHHSIPLIQEGDAIPASAHCRWNPYQMGKVGRSKRIE